MALEVPSAYPGNHFVWGVSRNWRPERERGEEGKVTDFFFVCIPKYNVVCPCRVCVSVFFFWNIFLYYKLV